jgi:type I restriction enzyme M protein
MNHSEIVSFVWGVADLIRDTFRRGHYQDVILPLTVLRRLDCVLADTKGGKDIWSKLGHPREPIIG